MHEQLRQHYLQAMGVQLWEPRVKLIDAGQQLLPVADAPAVDSNSVDTVVDINGQLPAADTSTEQGLPDWQTLQQRVESCQACALHEGRIQTVFGTGSQTARVMFIGEAPGADEDRQGEPFVGRAGKLLNEMLLAIGFKREQVYIANILKCRPPNNRDPRVDEVSSCETFLHQQIQLLQPELIVALGRIAAHNLLKTDVSLGRLRGQLHVCPGIDVPVMVTYHPAYLLRSPLEKRKAWSDLAMLQQKLGAEGKV
jgi:DNA polymerase